MDFTDDAYCETYEREFLTSPNLDRLLRSTINTSLPQPASRLFKKPDPVAAAWMETFLSSVANPEILKARMEADINREMDRTRAGMSEVQRLLEPLVYEGMDVISGINPEERPSGIHKRLKDGLGKLVHDMKHDISLTDTSEAIGHEMRASMLYVPGGRANPQRLSNVDKKKALSCYNVAPDDALMNMLTMLNVSSDEYKTVLKEADRYMWDESWEAFHVEKDPNRPELLTMEETVKLINMAESGYIPALAFRSSVKEAVEAEWGEGRALRIHGRNGSHCMVVLYSPESYGYVAHRAVSPSEVLLPADPDLFITNTRLVSEIFWAITPKAGLETNVRGVPEPGIKHEARFGR